jgi:hypothetical protein
MSDDKIAQLQAQVLKLEQIIALSAKTCGQNHCNCPGAPKMKKLVQAYVSEYPLTATD